jgi:hypothetical protein
VIKFCCDVARAGSLHIYSVDRWGRFSHFIGESCQYIDRHVVNYFSSFTSPSPLSIGSLVHQRRARLRTSLGTWLVWFVFNFSSWYEQNTHVSSTALRNSLEEPRKMVAVYGYRVMSYATHSWYERRSEALLDIYSSPYVHEYMTRHALATPSQRTREEPKIRNRNIVKYYVLGDSALSSRKEREQNQQTCGDIRARAYPRSVDVSPAAVPNDIYCRAISCSLIAGRVLCAVRWPMRARRCHMTRYEI